MKDSGKRAWKAIVGNLSGTELWRRSQDAFREASKFPFDGEAIGRWCAEMGAPHGLKAELDAAWLSVSKNQEVLNLFRHYYYAVFIEKQTPPFVPVWPEDIPGARIPALQMLGVMAGLPLLYERHRRLGIPEEVTRGTLTDILIWARAHQEEHGVWGVDQFDWLSGQITSDFVRLGRLQFMPASFPPASVVFCKTGTGELAVLAEDGLVLDEGGAIPLKSGDAVWKSRLERGDRVVVGHPVSPRGYVRRETVSLTCGEWKQILARGDGVLDVHIPAGSPLTPEECDASFRRAVEFFPRYFPACHFKGFVCHAWLLDPVLTEMLPPDSNLALFAKRWRLYRVEKADGVVTVWRVFGKPSIDIKTIQPSTSMQQSVLSHLQAGGGFNFGAGFILSEEVK